MAQTPHTARVRTNLSSSLLFPPLPPLHSPLAASEYTNRSGLDAADDRKACSAGTSSGDDGELSPEIHLRAARYVTHYFHLLACQDLCAHGATLRDVFVDEETKLTGRLQQVHSWLAELGHYSKDSATWEVHNFEPLTYYCVMNAGLHFSF